MTVPTDNLTLPSAALYGTPETAVAIVTLKPGEQYFAPDTGLPQDWVVMSGQIQNTQDGVALKAGKYGTYHRFGSGQVVSVSNPLRTAPAMILILQRYPHRNNPAPLPGRPVTEERPWGNFTVLADEADYKLKELIVKPGGCLSLQRHEKRAEHWFILKGTPTVTKGRSKQTLKAGDYIEIPRHAWHRIDNRNGTEDVVLVELQKGSYFGEDDIERKQDVYGRK